MPSLRSWAGHRAILEHFGRILYCASPHYHSFTGLILVGWHMTCGTSTPAAFIVASALRKASKLRTRDAMRISD